MEKNSILLNKKIFEWLGMLVSIISVLSLFGKLGVVTFEEWMTNFLTSYRNLFHPIVDFIISPIQLLLKFELNPIQKDSLIFYTFWFDRYIIEAVAYPMAYPQKRMPIFKLSIKSLQYINNSADKYNEIFLKFIRKLYNLVHNSIFIQKIIALSASIYIVVNDRSSKSYWFLGDFSDENKAFISFFLILFLLPSIFFIMHVLHIFIDSIKIFPFLIFKKISPEIINEEYNIRKMFKDHANSPLLLLAKRQGEYSIYFVSILFVIVAVGRDQGLL